MLFGEKENRTSAAFIICLGLAVFGTGMDILSYVLEYASVGRFLLTGINMLAFFGFDFELLAFAFYIWSLISEKEEVPSALCALLLPPVS